MAFVIRPFSSHIIKKTFCKNFHNGKILSKSYNIDQIDWFVKDLVREKSEKWRNISNNLPKMEIERVWRSGRQKHYPINILLKGFFNEIENIYSLDCVQFDISKLSKFQINSIILETISSRNDSDFNYIISQCVKKKILPDINEVLKYLSSKGDLETITELQALYREIYCEENLLFYCFTGYAVWIRGNVNLAIDSFKKFYYCEEYSQNLHYVHEVFKFIVNDTFNDKGEAVLYSLVKLGNYLCTQYDDLFLLVYLWKKSFASHWFSDQNLSKEIFEENEQVREMVSQGSCNLCEDLLRKNNSDAVYRLIEIFLEFNETQAIEICLKSLFDYHYGRRDVRSCLEIKKFCNTLNIHLDEVCNIKLLHLLLGQNFKNSRQIIKTGHKVQFKF